jgi:hypothetical protein
MNEAGLARVVLLRQGEREKERFGVVLAVDTSRKTS